MNKYLLSFSRILATTSKAAILMIMFLSSSIAIAQNVTRMITDYNGYYSSSSTALNTTRTNNRHNLLAFENAAVIYSTGVNNGILTANGINFIASEFRALPIGTLPGSTGTANDFLAMGRAIDGDAAVTNYLSPAISNLTVKDVLTDGIHGLDIGTGVTNIKTTMIVNFPIGNININALTDAIPEILISQIADPSPPYDIFAFLDSAGNVVGTAYTAVFTNPPILARYDLDLFRLQPSTPYATAIPNGNTVSGNTYRDIRMMSLKFSDFGITSSNYMNIVSLRWSPAGNSDPAFVAYNANSFSPRTVWTGAESSSWNNKKNWLNDLVPDETIDAEIPNVGANFYPIISTTVRSSKNLTIASGASVTVNGTGVLNIAGSISNAGTLNAVDGTIGFIGKTAQSIPVNTFSTGVIKNLIVKNTAGVTMNSATSLTGILTVNDGGSFNTNDFLTLKSTASQTAIIASVAGTVTGKMTIERYIPAKRAFRFLSSPTDGGTIRSNWMENGVDVAGLGTDITGAGGASNGFDISGSNNPSLFTYLNNNPGPGANWNAVTSANISQVAGVPYRMLVRGDRLVDQTNNNATATATTLRTKGTIKYGNVSVSDLNPIADGFNLIGNPYQSPVNMYTLLNDASTTGIKKTFYTIWDPNVNTRGGYVTVTFAPLEVNDIVSVQDNTSPTNTGASRYLQPGQAAFVQTQVAGAPSLIFKENQKALSFSNVFRQANDGQSKIRFTLYTANALANGNSAADGFVVTFDESDENAANEFDAIKAVNQDESLGMMNSDKIYSFQRMAMPTLSDVIPLSSAQYRTTDYTFRVAVDGLTDVTPMLLDKYTQTTTELTNDNVTDVNFTVDPAIAASTDANRFDIIFQETALGNTDNAFGNAIRLYPNPSATGNFFVALPNQFAGQASVEIVSLLGQRVFTQTTNATSNVLDIQPTSQLQAGVYFVNVTTAQGKATKKLIIK